MPEVTLRISADASELQRALAQSVKNANAAAKAISAAARKASDDVNTSEVAKIKMAERAEKERIKSALRLEAFRRKSEEKMRDDATKAMEQATKIAEAEARTRGRVGDDEASRAREIAAAMLNYRQAAEVRETRVVEQQSQRRRRVRQQEAAEARRQGGGSGGGRNGFRRAGASILNGIGDVVGSASDDIQSARRQVGDREHALNQALTQTGAGFDEIGERRAQILRFAADHHMDPNALSDAASVAQTETSSLAGATKQDRDQAMRSFLDTALMASNAYENPGEITRMAGTLRLQGMTDPEMIRTTLMTMIGIGRTGAISVGNVGAEALGPMMANINSALAGHTFNTPADRAAAIQRAVTESLASAELARSAGLSPRDSLNGMDKLRRYANNDTTNEQLYQRLHSMSRNPAALAAAREMFATARDDQGNTIHRLRDEYRTADNAPAALVTRLATAFGGDSTRLLNAMGKGDGGVVFDSQTRRLIGANLAQSVGDDGRLQTGWQRVASMRQQSISEGDLQTGERLRLSEINTQLLTQTENHIRAVLDNTAALNASNEVARYRAEHPFLSSMADKVPFGGLALNLANSAVGATMGSDGPIGTAPRGFVPNNDGGELVREVRGLREDVRNQRVAVNPIDIHHARALAGTGANAPRPGNGGR